MAASKTSKTLRASASVSAGATASCTEWNMSTCYGGLAVVRLTNGASAPTTAPVVKFYVGDATGVKRLFFQQSGDTTNNSVNDIVCELPMSTMFCNIDIVNGATNSITAEAYGQELTTI